MKALTTIATVALFTAASLATAQQPALQTDDSFTWTGQIASGSTLRMRNVAGQINVERSTNGRVQVTGRKEWRRGDPADVRFEVVPERGDVVICALWFESTCATDERRASSPRSDANRDRSNDVSVVFTVRLPAGVHLDAKGVSAGISVTGAGGEVSAESVSGDVVLADVSGNVRAHSVSGDVNVGGATVGSMSATTVSGDVQFVANALSGDGDLRFESVSGNVEATLPAALNADVRMGTVSGRVNSEFPLTSAADRRRQRDIEVQIGSGGRALTFSTVSGNITLRRR